LNIEQGTHKKENIEYRTRNFECRRLEKAKENIEQEMANYEGLRVFCLAVLMLKPNGLFEQQNPAASPQGQRS
jgi:hypothetical protein